MTEDLAIKLGAALGIGLLIGMERERTKGSGPGQAPAGIRTFALASLAGAVAYALGGEVLLGVIALALVLLVALVSRPTRGDPGLTTDVALVLTVLLGGFALRETLLAAGAAVAVTILLVSRSRLHHFVKRMLSEAEMHDVLLFAAATLVVLPLTPDRFLGPYDALNPRTIWKIVLLVMLVSALGHVALRAFGVRFGLPLAGFAGGFISSAATINSMGARARKEPALLMPAAAAAVFSNIATVIQMAVVLQITHPATLHAAAVPLLFAGGAALVYGGGVAFLAARAVAPNGTLSERRPLDPREALTFAAVIAFVLLLSAALHDLLGSRGAVLATAAVGFADAHSAGLSAASLAEAGKLSVADAVLAVLVALSTNSVTKAGLAVHAGGLAYARRVVPGIVLILVAAWVGYFLMSAHR